MIWEFAKLRKNTKTHTQITYDGKGDVIRGSDATTDDIAESPTRKYVTALNAVSGVNTGNQTSIVGITGMAFTVGKLYDFYIFAPQGATTVYWRIDNLTDNTSFEGSATDNLPGTGTYMRAGFQLATLTSVARNVRMKKIYVETDY